MSNMSTKFVVERKVEANINWLPISYPPNNIVQAIQTTEYLRKEEQNRMHIGEIRLVKITREIIDT